MAEVNDKYVTLVNPQGVEEKVWDFADHVQQMLARGFTKPGVKKEVLKETSIKQKEL